MDIQIDNAIKTSSGILEIPAIALAVKVVTATYSIVDTDYVIFADSNSGAFTVTLPSATGRAGREFRIIRTNAGEGEDITVTPVGGGDIVLDARYEAVTVLSNGEHWYVTAKTT